MRFQVQADFVIIGGGSAGCVLANRLSENPKHLVILIEAGGQDRNPLIHIPAGYIKTMVNPSINWMFKSEPEPNTAGRAIDFPRGKVLGGSSAINAMLYVRGQKADYDTWAQRGNRGWSYADVLPYFKCAEDCRLDAPHDATDTYHGRGGPLTVSNIRSTYPALDMVIEAAKTRGYPHNRDYNGAEQDGFSYYQVTQKNGIRHSARRAFLSPIKARKNLTILTHTRALRWNTRHHHGSARNNPKRGRHPITTNPGIVGDWPFGTFVQFGHHPCSSPQRRRRKHGGSLHFPHLVEIKVQHFDQSPIARTALGRRDY
jgi:choline dehydrogenase